MNTLEIKNKSLGFTLLEILLVVAMLGILAGIVIIAINPGKQLAETRDAQRKVDVNTIINAVYQYSVDNQGVYPDSITTSQLEICQTAADSCSGKADLSDLTNLSKYLVSLPVDPSNTSEDGTGYFIVRTDNSRINISAPAAESGAISITR